ncbi:hypothetical protein LguiA_011311 [Lonicera macranthoides]
MATTVTATTALNGLQAYHIVRLQPACSIPHSRHSHGPFGLVVILVRLRLSLSLWQPLRWLRCLRFELLEPLCFSLTSSPRPALLVVAGTPFTRLVERNDNWESARVIGKYSALRHRLPTATTVKDRKVYIRHLFGMGYPGNKHALVEALFTS